MFKLKLSIKYYSPDCNIYKLMHAFDAVHTQNM